MRPDHLQPDLKIESLASYRPLSILNRGYTFLLYDIFKAHFLYLIRARISVFKGIVQIWQTAMLTMIERHPQKRFPCDSYML